MNRKWIPLITVCLVGMIVMPVQVFPATVRPPQRGEVTLRVGERLPDVPLTATTGETVTLARLDGRVKLISIVPQLNTPVCDEQTHHFSEQNGGLDRQLELITVSTNTSEDQVNFAKKARISNIRFFSDAPDYAFGKKTGLLLPLYGVLHRAVMVADADNVIRYLQVVPMGELPNFDAAYDAARHLVQAHER